MICSHPQVGECFVCRLKSQGPQFLWSRPIVVFRQGPEEPVGLLEPVGCCVKGGACGCIDTGKLGKAVGVKLGLWAVVWDVTLFGTWKTLPEGRCFSFWHWRIGFFTATVWTLDVCALLMRGEILCNPLKWCGVTLKKKSQPTQPDMAVYAWLSFSHLFCYKRAIICPNKALASPWKYLRLPLVFTICLNSVPIEAGGGLSAGFKGAPWKKH